MTSPVIVSFLLLVIFSAVHSRHEYFDSKNVKIVLFYGPTRNDSVAYPLSEAEKVLDDPHFNRTSTTLYAQDYHEPQWEGFRNYILTDAYSELQICNFLVLDWGTRLVPIDDIKDPDIDTLVPMVTKFLTEVHNRTNWEQFSVVAYARGVEFMVYVVSDLFQKTSIRIPRISQLAPQLYYLNASDINPQSEIITQFVDTIHTDIGNHETNATKAHAEFFPNGGLSPQPGCPQNEERLNICSRTRSLKYWAESLRNPLAFCGLKADSYEDYKEGKTDLESEEPMGIACMPEARGKYYLKTNAEPPFGKGCTQEKWTSES